MKIDLIIPFKSGVDHIEKICSDLSNQTSKEFVVYFISDHSEDDTIEKINTLNLDFEYKLLELPAPLSGPGAARNVGILNGNSELIGFIDIDDRISIDYVNKFITKMNETDADIVECMFESITPNGSLLSRTNIVDFLSSENRFDALLKGIVPRLSWAKVYRRTTIEENKVTFPEGIHNGEDHVFLLRAYSNNPTLALIYDPMYKWVRHSDSLTNRPPTSKTVSDLIKVNELKFEIFNARAFNSRLSHNEIKKQKLDFSRRLFKESRMLIKSILEKNSSEKNELISILREGSVNSSTLEQCIAIIKADTTSYWHDVFSVNY